MLEINYKYKVTNLCEPQLGNYNLYEEIGTKENYTNVSNLLNFLAYADGDHDLIQISHLIKVDIKEVDKIAKVLLKNGLIKAILP